MMRIARKVTEPIKRRVQMMVSRAVVNLVNDGGAMQIVQVSMLADEVDDAEHFQPYGFTSSPPGGSEAVVVFPQGNRDHPIVVVVADRGSRFAGLAPKDSALYTDKGNRVHVKSADGSIAVVPVDAGLVHLGADVAADFVALSAKVDAELAAIKTAYDAHTHTHGIGPGTTAIPVPLIPAQSSTAATKAKAT
jgi:phage baseplate assembly protein V